jgi:hypothetical protein
MALPTGRNGQLVNGRYLESADPLTDSTSMKESAVQVSGGRA